MKPTANTYRPGRIALGLLLVIMLAACGRKAPQSWALTDIRGHLPDLQFDLTADNGKTATAADFRGKVVLLYFGYTHCPDVCPMMMARLSTAVKSLGDEARDVRILFVSVDPYRDTPELMGAYTKAFSAQAVGLTGTPQQIATIAKRYRVAYEADRPDKDGNYAVMHSKSVFVFDPRGRVRLLATDTDTPGSIAHDLGQLLKDSR